MNGMVTICHAARKGGYNGSHLPTHLRASVPLDEIRGQMSEFVQGVSLPVHSQGRGLAWVLRQAQPLLQSVKPPAWLSPGLSWGHIVDGLVGAFDSFQIHFLKFAVVGEKPIHFVLDIGGLGIDGGAQTFVADQRL